MKKLLFLLSYVSVALMSYAQLPPLGEGSILDEEKGTFEGVVNDYYQEGDDWEAVWNKAVANGSFIDTDITTQTKFRYWFNPPAPAGTSPVGDLAWPIVLLLLAYGSFVLFRRRKTVVVMALLAIGATVIAETRIPCANYITVTSSEGIPNTLDLSDGSKVYYHITRENLTSDIEIQLTLPEGTTPVINFDIVCGDNAYPTGFDTYFPMPLTEVMECIDGNKITISSQEFQAEAYAEFTNLYFEIGSSGNTGESHPTTPCDLAYKLEAGYSEVKEAGTYWFSSDTYYLPIYMSIFPEDMNDLDSVWMDLACDGNYTGVIAGYKNMLESMSGQFFGKALTFPLAMNEMFSKEIKNTQGEVIGYVFDFPATFRQMLMDEGVKSYAPAYVKVKLAGKARIVVQSGLETSCRDIVPQLEMNTYIPIVPDNESVPSIFMFPVGKWLDANGYKFEWIGPEGSTANIYIASNCTPTIANSHKSFILPEEAGVISAEENEQFISDFGTELYLKCSATANGYIKVLSLPTTTYSITEAVIGGVKAEIKSGIINAVYPNSFSNAETVLADPTTKWKAVASNGEICYVYTRKNESLNKYEAIISNSNGDELRKYRLDISRSPIADKETDCSLSDIQIDGVTIKGFSPHISTYDNVEILDKTSLTVTKSNTAATVAISPTLTTSSTLPATVTITVTAEAHTDAFPIQRTYTLNLIQLRSSEKCLSMITVDGVEMPDFDTNCGQFEYFLTGLKTIPNIKGTPSYSAATVKLIEADRLPGYTQLIVTAENGDQQAYTVYLFPKDTTGFFTAHGKVTVKAEPLEGGKVFAGRKENLTPSYTANNVELPLTATETYSKLQPVAVDTVFFTWANANAGYYFEGWNTDKNNIDYFRTETSAASFIETMRASTAANPTILPTYYAHFRHPQVLAGNTVAVEIGTSGEITGCVPFTVKDVKAVNELRLTLPEVTAESGISFGAAILEGDQYIIPFTLTPAVSTQTLTITLASYDNNPENSKTATLNITKLTSALGDFAVSGSAGHGNISLSWESVSDAAEYEIRQNGVTKATVTTTTYTASGLAIGATYEYTVVAKNVSHEPIAVGTKALTTGIITAATAESFTLDLPYYSTFNAGAKTIKTESSTITNLAHLFNGTQTVMDTLYLLVDDTQNPKNAVCYVYAANAAKTEYAVSETFNPRTQCRVLDDFNGKKLYFAGSCLNAYTGSADESEGFFYFKGTGNSVGEQVDIYLENLTVTTKAKNVITKAYTIFDALGWDGHLFFKGGSSVFAFYSNTPDAATPVKANFHVKGKSELQGNQGCSFELYGPHPLVSAPIASRPVEDDGNCVTFTFDDKWGDTRTNGWLGFRSQSNAPSIDLGNEKGKVIFNGGQYRLWGSGKVKGHKSTGYGTTLAISFRHYSFLTVSVYGFGDDKASGLGVHIYDGTFSSYTQAEGSTAYEGANANIYRNAADIRLPWNSTINGGTFNDNAAVYLCNNNSDLGILPLNEAGQSLCRFETTWTKSIPADGSPLIVDLATDFEYDLSGLKTFKDDNPSAITGSKQYGAKGLNVGNDGKLYLYVNIETLAAAEGKDVDCTLPKYENWAVAFPAIEVTGGSLEMLSSMSMGGDTSIPMPDPAKGLKPTAYVAYVELDDLTLQKGGMQYKDPTIKVSEFKNPAGAEVQKAIYMIMPIMSNVNYQLIPPFDVHKIYVIEHSVTGEIGSIPYKEALASANFNMFRALMGNIAPKTGTSNAGSLQEILLNTTLVSPTPRLSEAIPYNPAVAAQDENHAHFFMYESKDRGLWKLGEPTGYNWDYLTYDPTGETPLMKKPEMDWDIMFDEEQGAMRYKVYFLHFPSNNNFWDNRYIVLEGKGSQKLYGSADLKIEDPDFGNGSIVGGEYGQLMGNFTFKRYQAEENGYYLYDASTKNFVQQSGHDYFILPGRTFMTVNHSGPAQIQSFDLDGNINYVGEMTDGLNTLNTYSLIVTGGENTLTIQALQAQEVAVYNVAGQLVTTIQMGAADIQTITLSAGAYLVSAGGNTQKVIVR